jgi:hypothetical protein
MKNTQRGFIIPLVIAVVVIMGISGGTYIYLKKDKLPTNSTPSSGQNALTDEMASNNSNLDNANIGEKVYKNNKYKFSINYPESKYSDDNKARENAIYLHPTTKSNHFSIDNVTIIFSAVDFRCDRIASNKKTDGQTLTIGDIVFQHVSGKVKTPQNKVIDNYEVFDKYFYTKNDTCYSAALGTFTGLSKKDLTDRSGNRMLSDADIQKQWEEIENEINNYKSDFKEIVASFKII